MKILDKNNPKLILIFAFCIFHIAHSLYLNPLGHFSVDEAVYHLMTRSFSEAGIFEIWNGYQEFPSKELALGNVRVHDGRLVPQYPYLYPVLASPFYSIAGYHGLFILNAVAFLGVVGFCFALAHKLFVSLDIALNSCLILILSTYAWEYSQAAWPHALSMLFVTAAFYFATISAYETDLRKSMAFSFSSGIIAGFGAGVRLDIVFVFPAIIALFLFVRPWRPRVLAACFGIAPGLIVLTVSNYLKFGEISPFSYGSTGGTTAGIGPYLPLVFLALTLIVGHWILRRYAARVLKRPGGIALALLTVGLGVSIFPAGRTFFSNLAVGAYQLIVDLRIRSLEILEPALTRTSDGAIVYLHMGLKKSLLQSCPYMSILFFPLAGMVRERKYFSPIGCLYLVPVIFVGVFSYFAWHGGLCFNLRYFLPVLPFTSIITAIAWQQLTQNSDENWRYLLIISGLLTYFFYCLITYFYGYNEEAIYLTFPLILASVLFLLLLSVMILEISGTQIFIRRAPSLVLVMALVWSGLVAFHYDFRRVYAQRSIYSEVSQKASTTISSNSILFTDSPDAFFGLIERDRIRLAMPANDNFRDFRSLVFFHLDAGHQVYCSFDSVVFQRVNEKGLLQSLDVIPLLEHQFGTLVQVVKSPAPLALDTPLQNQLDF